MTEPTSHSETNVESVFSGQGSIILAGASLGWLITQTIWYLVPALLPTIIDDLSISPFYAGLALSVMTGAYALAQYPSGQLSDQINKLLVILLAACFLVLGSLLLSVSITFGMFVIATFLCGVGKGLYSTSARTLVTEYYVEKRGQALGIFTSGTDLGGAVASGVAVLALAVATWQAAFPVLAAALAVSVGLLTYANEKPFTIGVIRFEIRETISQLTTTRKQRGVLVSYALLWFVVFGFVNFLPTMLQVEQNLDPGPATSAFALLFVIGAIMKPLGGTVSDWLSRSRIAVTGLLLAAFALVLILTANSYSLIIVGIILFAVGYKPLFPVMEAYFVDAAPESSVGANMGTMLMVTVGAGSLGPAYVGFVADVTNFTIAFATLAFCLLVSGTMLQISS